MMKVELTYDGQVTRNLRGTAQSHDLIQGGRKSNLLEASFISKQLFVRLMATVASVAATLISANTVSAASATATPGQSVTLTVTASGTAPFAYQWMKNGSSISAAT